jgi:hypothetical protein
VFLFWRRRDNIWCIKAKERLAAVVISVNTLFTKMKRFLQHFSVVSGALLLVAATGCNRDSVTVYNVGTNETIAVIVPPPASSGMGMPASMPDGLLAPDNSGLPKLKYTLPAGWKEKALTQMRVASFDLVESDKQIDVSVIPLGGKAGGDAPNVNRWRGQVGLAPLEEMELAKLAEKIEIAGQPAELYDVTGTAPGSGDAQRILGVILHRDETAWFFKMTGDADLAAKQKPAFIAFLKSVEFGGLPAPSTMDLSQLPPTHPPISAATTAPAEASDTPTWAVPSDWQTGQLAQFLVAKYVIAGTGAAKAEVNVSSLDGDGGGLAPNVNRWRGQLGLPPAEDIKTTALEVAGGSASVVEFEGTNARTGQAARLVAAVVPVGSQTWFYKLMGEPALVVAQKDAFLKFIQSAQYPHGH